MKIFHFVIATVLYLASCFVWYKAGWHRGYNSGAEDKIEEINDHFGGRGIP